MNAITTFLKDENGATTTEYGLIAVLVSLAAIVSLDGVGYELDTVFNYIYYKLRGETCC